MQVILDIDHHESFSCNFKDYWEDSYNGMSKEEIEKHITKAWLDNWEDWVIIDENFDISLEIKLDDAEYSEFIGEEPDHFEFWAKVVRESRERRKNANLGE